MKKFTSALAVVMVTAMVATGAFAQAGGGAGAGAGAGSGSGAAAGGTGGTGTGAGATSGSGSSSDSTTSGATTGSPATGVDRSRAEQPKAGSTGSSAGTSTGTTSTPSASPATSSAASGDFTGRHTMEGEVTKVDHKSGKFSLKTKDGTLDLHAPASALQNVKKGDRLAVEIAVKPMAMSGVSTDKDTKGSASPKMDKEKK